MTQQLHSQVFYSRETKTISTKRCAQEHLRQYHLQQLNPGNSPSVGEWINKPVPSCSGGTWPMAWAKLEIIVLNKRTSQKGQALNELTCAVHTGTTHLSGKRQDSGAVWKEGPGTHWEDVRKVEPLSPCASGWQGQNSLNYIISIRAFCCVNILPQMKIITEPQVMAYKLKCLSAAVSAIYFKIRKK